MDRSPNSTGLPDGQKQDLAEAILSLRETLVKFEKFETIANQSHNGASNDHPKSAAAKDKPPIDQETQETEAKVASLKSASENRRTLDEEVPKEVSVLRERISKQAKEIQELKRMLIRSGQKHEGQDDQQIANRFLTLKTEIFRFCKSALPAGVDYPSDQKDASRDMNDLLMSAQVAQEIHQTFFHPSTQLFGHLDTLQYGAKSKQDGSSYQMMEQRFTDCQDSDVTEDDIKEWRILTINIVKQTNRNPDEYPEFQAERIWTRLYQYSAHFKNPKQKIPSPPKSWFELCKTAYDLGLLFRSSRIEYQWQQDQDPMYIKPADAEILGTTGVSTLADEKRVYFVVFGSVVRGHRNTGKLRDGLSTLAKPSVVIDYAEMSERRLK